MTMRLRRNLKLGLAALGFATCAQVQAQAAPPEHPRLGLMGTVPIYWGEAATVSEAIGGQAPRHWARSPLEQRFDLFPLDRLDDASLRGLSFLLLAQPRALSPYENVSLDAWVRAGGHLLVFADPLMTGESRFAIGDRRRPQDVILLSPILDHWGLHLEFAEDQTGETHLVTGDGPPIPVRLAGRFAVERGEEGCALAAESVLARCAIGRGSAVLLADSALLDLQSTAPEARDAFVWLLTQAFPDSGNFAGNRGHNPDAMENPPSSDGYDEAREVSAPG